MIAENPMVLIFLIPMTVDISTIVQTGLDSRKNHVAAICISMPKLVYVTGPQWLEEIGLNAQTQIP